MSMWEIELKALTANGVAVKIHFVAMARTGEAALDKVLKEHKKYLKGMEIQIEKFSPMVQDSIFIYWEEQ